MSEKAYPFSAGDGRFVTEEDWTAMVSAWQDNGVLGHPGDTTLKIAPGATPGTIDISPGVAQIDGFTYRLTATRTLDTVANSGGADRTDLVVLRLSTADSTITPVLRDGTTVSGVNLATEIPLGEWIQPPAGSVTGTFWGTPLDRRWFMGARVRPHLAGAVPPASPGGLTYEAASDSTGTVYLGKVNTSGTPYWAPWKPWASERVDPVEASNGSDVSTTNPNFTASVTPQVSATFMAPPSGKVYVTINAQLEATGTAVATASYEIRVGSASGAQILEPSIERAAIQQASSYAGSSNRKMITGLNPGTTYFIRVMHKVSDSGYTASFFHRSILVEPVYTDVAPGSPGAGDNTWVPGESTVTAAPTNPLIRHNRNYAIGTSGPNIMEFRVSGVNAAWLNRWGGYRAAIPAADESAVVVKTHTAQTARPIEIQNAAGTAVWGVDPDGYAIHGNGTGTPVKLAPVLVLGAADPVPAGTPAGTVILRT